MSMHPQTAPRHGERRSKRRKPRQFTTALAVIVVSLFASAGVASAAHPITETEVKFYASDATTEVGFGRAVAIDGDTALVSSAGLGPLTGAEGQAEVAIGSVYVFVRDGDEWTEQAKITANDAVDGDRFGHAVALSGNIALISSPYDDNEGEDSGSAYLYQREGSTWTKLAQLTASDAIEGDQFGSSVAIDGHLALVSAPGDDDDGEGSGSVYVFTRPSPDSLTLGGSAQVSWTQEAKLTASDADANDSFGRAVALSGTAALVGAPGNDDRGDSSGSAYIFRRVDLAWSETDKLTANDAGERDYFGSSVDISSGKAIVAAPNSDHGAAYIFGQDIGSIAVGPGGAPPWVQHAKLTATPSDASADFGTSVAISATVAAVGAFGGDAASNVRGSVHLFSPTVSSWAEHTMLTATVADGNGDHGATEWFGGALAMSGHKLIIGSSLDDDVEVNAGAAYVFAPEPPKAPKVENPCAVKKSPLIDSLRSGVDRRPLPECPRIRWGTDDEPTEPGDLAKP